MGVGMGARKEENKSSKIIDPWGPFPTWYTMVLYD